jgi:hypothetical protein
MARLNSGNITPNEPDRQSRALSVQSRDAHNSRRTGSCRTRDIAPTARLHQTTMTPQTASNQQSTLPTQRTESPLKNERSENDETIKQDERRQWTCCRRSPADRQAGRSTPYPDESRWAADHISEHAGTEPNKKDEETGERANAVPMTVDEQDWTRMALTRDP